MLVSGRLQKKMGDELIELGGRLECNQCDAVKPLSAEKIADYLSFGWPKCCGLTMTWKTAKQLGTPPGS